MIGWTPPDGSGRTPTPGDEARRAAFMLFALLAALAGVLAFARDLALLWVAVPCAVAALALLLAPLVLDRRR
ncbi:hypothetical protein [Amnibacterium endophyticum]|uniref:Uncharacterized protein n=1 Tax=Amnibacterium endophyticum TaxID=2109337 RepID=A0ABW4LDG9_9MICO